MKKILLVLFISFASVLQAQEFQLLKKSNDIEILYRLKKTKENDKNVTYLMELTYKNLSGKDIYYNGLPPKTKNSQGQGHFAMVEVSNVNFFAFSDSDAHLSGEKSNLSFKGEPIYIIRSGKEYDKSFEFKLKKELEPVIVAKTDNEIIFKTNLYDFL